MSIRRHAKELEFHKKIMKIVIKQDLCPDFKPFDYAIWGVLESEKNATSHPNFGSLRRVIEEEWNKMPEEYILKACKSFWKHVDIIIENIFWPYWVMLLFGVYLPILMFCFLFFKLKLILFYYWVLHNYYSKLFLILLPHLIKKDLSRKI